MTRHFLLLVLIFASNSSVAAEVYLQLKPEVTLDRLDVYLEDVAEVAVNDPFQKKIFSQKPIARVKSLSHPTALTRRQIEDALIRLAPTVNGAVTWGGEESILVKGKTRVIDLASGIEASRDWLTERVYPQLGEVELDLVGGKEQLDVPMGRIEQRPDTGRVRRLGNSVELPLEVLVDGAVYAKPILHFKIRQLSAVSDASSYAPARANRNAYDKNKTPSPVLDVANIENEINLKTNQYMKKRDILIEKNQLVKIIFQSGPMRIESEGIAQSDAYAGEQVNVKRSNSTDVLVGQAYEKGLILVGGN